MKFQIDDINDSKLDQFRNLKDKNINQQNLLIIESKKVVLKAIQEGVEILTLLTTASFFKEYSHSINAKEIYIIEDHKFKNLLGFNSHTKIFAIGKIPSHKLDYEKNIIFFNNITSPENVGAIARSALAFNYNQIIYDSKSLSPWNRRPIRVSTGNMFKFKTMRTTSPIDTIKNLREKNYQVISTANDASAVNLTNFNPQKKHVIIFGSEGHGIEKTIKEASDVIVKIPVDQYVKHLNVGHAAAITMYSLRSKS